MLDTFHPVRRCARTLFLSLVLAATGATAAAADFPSKEVRLVVPFAPGGGTDVIARSLGAEMAKALGQSVIVDNKPGAGTVIGTQFVAKAPADGHTLVVATFAHAVNPSLVPSLPFSTRDDFAPVALIAKGPNVLVVHPDSPYKTVKDIIDASRAEPGKLTYASQGNGTSAHLAGEMLMNLAGIRMMHIPYRGAGPAMTDLLGGRVDMIFGTAAAVARLVETGRLRAIAVTTPERSPAYKNVPTVAETVPGYAVESWYGLYVPAGTPADVIAKLNAAASKAARSSDFAHKIEPEGLVVVASEPAELDRYVRAEEVRWSKIVKENGIKLE